MVTVKMKTSGPMNRNSILSINMPEPQSVKNKNNITTIVKNTRNNRSDSLYSQQPDNASQYRQTTPQTAQQSYGQTQSGSTLPYGQSQNNSAQQPFRQPPSSAPQQPQNIQPALTAGQQNTDGTPIARPVPTLLNKVQKGQKTLLSTTALTAVEACFGWNVTEARCDVDVSAFLLGADGKVIGDSWFVFYGQTLSPDQSTRFVSGGGTDRELIQVDFKRLNPQVKKIVFVLTINDALANRLHFGMLKDAYVRILDQTGHELVSFLMTDYYNNVISMMIGELYQHNGAWKFNAVGNGVAKDLAGLCALYGVQVL